MRSRSAAKRSIPPVLPEKQRSLFLRASDRDSEFSVIRNAERCSVQVCENRGYFFIGERPSFNLSHRAGFHAFGQELKRSNAIAPDRREQAVSIAAVCLNAH